MRSPELHVYRAHKVTIRYQDSAYIVRRTFVERDRADKWARDTVASLGKHVAHQIEVEHVETMCLSDAAAFALRHARKAYRVIPTHEASDTAVW